MKSTTDIELGIGIREGREQEFALLFDRYHPLLMAYMVTYTGNSSMAEEIVQQAFVVLWEKRGLLKDGESPKHYLFAIARNLFKKKYKELRKRDFFLEELKVRTLNKAAEDSDYMEKRLERLREIMEALPARCKEILVLNKYEGLKYNQISEQLQISVKTVESQMRIAYQKIREGFETINKESKKPQKEPPPTKGSNCKQKSAVFVSKVVSFILFFLIS